MGRKKKWKKKKEKRKREGNKKKKRRKKLKRINTKERRWKDWQKVMANKSLLVKALHTVEDSKVGRNMEQDT